MGALFGFYAFLILLVLVSAGLLEALKALGFIALVFGAFILIGLLLGGGGGGRSGRDYGHPGSTNVWDGDGGSG